MLPNKLKATLQSGGTVFGPYIRHSDAGLAEVLCHLGFDFLLFDGEHAPISERDLENLARVCELTGVTSVARVPTNQPWLIGRTLDTGVQGIQIPMVNTAREAEAAVLAAKYQPRGQRGLAGARAAHFGMKPGFTYKDHIVTANRESLVIVQIETPAAIDALPEIVTIPDIDVIFIGPTDLSNSYGTPTDYTNPEVRRAFDRIIDIVAPTDKALGVLAVNAESTLDWRKRGARYIMCVFEAIMAPAIRGYLERVRADS